MTVPYVDHGRSYGGVLTVAENQVRWLSRTNDVLVLAPTRRGDEAYCQSLFDCEVVSLPAYRVARLGMTSVASPTLKRAARTVQADLAFVHLARDLSTPPAARALAARMPMVTQTHGMVIGGSLPRRALERVLTTPVLKAADVAFYLTGAEEVALRRVAPSASREFLPNGIDLDELDSIAPAPASERFRIGFVSRLTARKRPDIVLDLLAAVIGTGIDAEAVFAGPDDGMARDLEAKALDLGLQERFSYLGPLPRRDALSLIRGLDLVVLPSRHEPFPMVALEAMALGIPTAITEECGLADHLRPDSQMLVLPADRQQLVGMLTDIIFRAPELQRCARAQRDDVRRQFSMRSVNEQLQTRLLAVQGTVRS